jgi:hypothetical protein
MVVVPFRNKRREGLLNSIEKDLLKAGWPPGGIIRDSAIRIGTTLYRPSFALVFGSYPFAVLEISEDLSAFGEVVESGKLTAPLLLVTDGTRTQLRGSDGFGDWRGLPSPQELWLKLGRTWNETDPRLCTRSSPHRVRFHQAMAVGRLLDHAMTPARRGQVILSPGSGSMMVTEEILWKLLRTRRHRHALVLVDRLAIADQVLHRLLAAGFLAERATFPVNAAAEVLVSTVQFLLQESRYAALSVSSFDLLAAQGITSDAMLEPILDHFNEALAIGVFGWAGHERAFGQSLFEFTYDDARMDEPVPLGFEAVRLADVAEVVVGPHTQSKLQSQQIDLVAQETARLLLGRNLEFDGSWDVSRTEMTVVDSAFLTSSRGRIEPDDILLATIHSTSRTRWAIVPPEIPSELRIGSSVLRIRIRDPKVKPSDVATFLTSDSGRREMAYVATSVSDRFRLTASALGQLRVLLPERSTSVDSAIATELTATAAALRDIRALIPDLEGVERDEGEASGPSALAISVAERLREIARTLAPLPLGERVMSEYPTPIAKAYRQFHDSRFNLFERVARLRDVFEAVSFFVYNTILADALQRLNAAEYRVQDRNARRAYAGYSMSHRLTFVEAIVAATRSHEKNELFMPELASCSFVARARELQEFRNKTAHSITASEGQQRVLLDQYHPTIDSLLEELTFLADYRLVRIPSFYVKAGRHIRRMEVYRGVVPDLQEDALDEDDRPTMVEHDRLVLLNDDDETLDLYPMYQLISSAQTRFETHICFLKQKRGGRLEGESIQAAGEIELAGGEEFEALARKLE